jgi:RNA polymerase sigma factor (sigma-70 family)
MVNDTQHNLLILVKKGDAKAIEELYRSAFHQCSKYVTNNKGSEEDAQDIFQEALIVLFKKVREPNFELASTVPSFLYGIVRNLWLKKLRDEQKQGLVLTLDDPDKSHPMVEVDDNEQRIELEDRLLHLQRCMVILSEECRKLLDLSIYKKLNSKEIAQEMDYSENFVRVKKKRCIDGLKEEMQKKG